MNDWPGNDFDFNDEPKGTDMNAKTETIPEMVSVGSAIGGVVAKAGQSRQALQAQSAPAALARHEMTPMEMVGRALEMGVSPDILKQMMDLRDREEARNAERAFAAAMVAAQAEMPQVVRNAKNTQTNSLYAKYETISEAIQPIITKHGFACMFSEGQPALPNHIRTLCDVVHEAGHTKQFYADIPFDNVGMKGNANKTNTHAYGSTKSYGKRYLKCEIFDVAVKNQDDDGNAAGGEMDTPITEEQAATIRALIEETGTDIEKFCQWAKIEAVPFLLTRHYDKAVGVLQARKEKAA